ncbi:hypothetical protein [Streptococcus cuniculi]|uniref:Uncharacterized protein n=1 Tax=Streptococcus cuniculi TaxID=1432788 RepID=A0A4Y9JCZ7_9STRE|nr:hypothetical protein [Streptococcus cuniculi]MBF0778302.1 hypothetical protein [Streptococcus cuniculi]TFU97794.1 hypothetical protein E4T82_06120 [Streptococcus cuniculi]
MFLKFIKGCCLGCFGLILFLVLSLFLVRCSKGVEDRENREILVGDSALYIYNNYENIESIEYDNFEVHSFGLGTHVYSFDITVNGSHEFIIGGPSFDYEIGDSEHEVWAYEAREHPDGELKRKEPPTSEGRLPESVRMIDRTALGR